MTSPAPGPRVLLLSLSGIGNTLMATPLLRALRETHPHTRTDVMVAPRGTAEVLLRHPRVNEVLLSTPKPSWRQWVATIQNLQRRRYDVGLVTHPGQLVTSASLLAFGTVRRRIGYRYTWKFLRNSGCLLTDARALRDHTHLALSDRSAHDVVQNLRLLEPLGIQVDAPFVRYDFPLREEDHTRAEGWLQDRNLLDLPLIGMHPGTHSDLTYKRWPADRWVALSHALAEEIGAHVLMFGGPSEETLVRSLTDELEGKATPVGLSLRAAAALMARCQFFVSNDSGLMHVAVSQDVPTFGLFGPTDERRTAPWGTLGQVIRAHGTEPTYEVQRLRDVQSKGTDPSLLTLSVDTVLQRISEVLTQNAPS